MKETTHEKFRKALDKEVFEEWNRSLGKRSFGRMGNDKHFYFVRSEFPSPNSIHSYKDVIKLFKSHITKSNTEDKEWEGQEDGWISVEERLPEYLEDVLTIDKQGFLRILNRQDWESGNEFDGYESGELWYEETCDKEHDIEIVLYWMPLPKPPIK